MSPDGGDSFEDYAGALRGDADLSGCLKAFGLLSSGGGSSFEDYSDAMR